MGFSSLHESGENEEIVHESRFVECKGDINQKIFGLKGDKSGREKGLVEEGRRLTTCVEDLNCGGNGVGL